MREPSNKELPGVPLNKECPHAFSRRLLGGLLITAFSWQLAAQPIQSTSNHTANATYAVSSPEITAQLDEKFALGDELIRELRHGGYVLFVQHGPTLPGSVDQRGSGEWWRNCEKTQRLSPKGMSQARLIGSIIMRQSIPVDEVITSEFCRTHDMAIFMGLSTPRSNLTLNAGAVGAPDAGQIARLVDLISTPPKQGSNRLLVGHALPINAAIPALSILQDGHTAIFKPEGKGKFHLVTVLTPGQWQGIGQAVVAAQKPVAASATSATATSAPAASPSIDPAKELKGVALVNALRKGGYNLYMRHAVSTIGADQNLPTIPKWWENCAIQRNISDQGREQAGKVGAAIRLLEIPIGQVKAAQFCRTRDTAYLLGFGPVEIDESLNHAVGQRTGFDFNAARFKLLTETPSKGTNTLLVSHTHGSPRIEEQIMGGMQEAEIIVYSPNAKGGTVPLARIPLTEWDNLIKLTNPSQPKP